MANYQKEERRAGGKRSIAYDTRVKAALLKHIKYGKYEYVFVNKNNGQPYAARTRWLKEACQKAGVKKFSYHSIRHLTALWLDVHNVPLTITQKILRHKSSNTTARYSHELKGVQICLDEIFERKTGKILEFKKEKVSNNRDLLKIFQPNGILERVGIT